MPFDFYGRLECARQALRHFLYDLYSMNIVLQAGDEMGPEGDVQNGGEGEESSSSKVVRTTPDIIKIIITSSQLCFVLYIEFLSLFEQLEPPECESS